MTGDTRVASTGRVGIFWGIRSSASASKKFVIVTDETTLDSAEPYDKFLTHPRGHYDVWETWQRLGVSGLKRRRLPEAIAWREYEDFPRGRIVFDTQAARFTVYADKRLQNEEAMSDILATFGLTDASYVIESDAHYRSRPIYG